MNPRGYQSDCITGVERGFAEFRRVLAVLPTGSGKTIIFSLLADLWRKRGERTLIIAHRDELIDQAITKLHAATGIYAEKEKADSFASMMSPVVVASIQTLARRADRWPADHFAHVVCDEAHHALSASWQAVLQHFHAKVLGVTATADRGDHKNLGQFFETIGFEIPLFDLIHQGYLSRITLKSLPLEINLNGVRSVAGDFADADLGSALEPYLDQIAVAIRDHASFRRTLAFLPLIATSQKFVAACQAVGLSAEHIDGESPDRKEKLARFAAWEFDLLSNAMLLTEGFDDPGIDCVVCLRPTRSRPLYAQIAGRGTRTHPGKENLLLLDFLWLHQTHNIVRPASLIASDDREAAQITALAQQAALPADLAAQMPLDLETLAGEATAAREEALRKKLEEQRNKKAKTLSAEEFAVAHDSMETAEYLETMAWESQPATDKQIKVLRRAHIDVTTVRGKGHASKLISLVFRDAGLEAASPGQRAKMRQMGYPGWENATSGEARRFFASLRQPKQEEFSHV